MKNEESSLKTLVSLKTIKLWTALTIKCSGQPWLLNARKADFHGNDGYWCYCLGAKVDLANNGDNGHAAAAADAAAADADTNAVDAEDAAEDDGDWDQTKPDLAAAWFVSDWRLSFGGWWMSSPTHLHYY